MSDQHRIPVGSGDQARTSAREPTVTGFPNYDGFPSWLTWTAGDGCEVTYGDDGCGIITAPSGEQQLTVSAPHPAGSRWFVCEDPRGLAAALIAAADHIDQQRAALPSLTSDGG